MVIWMDPISNVIGEEAARQVMWKEELDKMKGFALFLV